MQELSVDWKSRSRTDYRVNAALWTKSSLPIIYPIFDLLRFEGLFAIETPTEVALQNLSSMFRAMFVSIANVRWHL